MALIHDMAESLVGDITPVDNIPKAEKSRRESTTMDFLCSRLLSPSAGVGPATGAQIREIWQEYEDGETLEAKFVHDIDKLELVLQMMEYERRGEGQVDLSEFGHVAKRIQLDECKAWCEEVFKEREEFWRSVGKPLKAGWRKTG
ncbi:MAG: hypothetical protein HETSPECPRED_001167 [Heterodermia speciosa]|uniref:HD domain-containing protein n=1 Tax=Heterodermia speciosa TaxID=116794 RepID=A0A8H3J108_9LECA|nr:MAG: hypothetical protein HETSPECPRED_001167 [Heterodermia speciosa]